MDLPPSGWYPDPYGTPDLLRWWDGSAWTQHTHPGVTPAGTGTAAGARQATGQQSVAGQHAGQAGAAQPGAAQPGSGQPGSGQPAMAVQREIIPATTVQPAAVQSDRPAGAGQVSTEQLSRTKPPTGQPTQPQPALPQTAVQPTVQPTTVQPTVQPTAYQAAVTGVQPTTVQPTVQPTTVQPTTVQAAALPQTRVQQPVAPTTVQPGPGLGQGQGQGQPGPWQGPGQSDASGTQVMFLGGDTWQAPGAAMGPGGPAMGSRYGYRAAQRRRRMWQMGGLAGGTVAAVAVIAVMVVALDKSPAPVASQTSAVPPTTAASSAASSASASSSPSVSPSSSVTAAGSGAMLTDTQSGLGYTLLSAPWQPTCPGTLNNGAFTWTAGESAVAGQVNGGQTTWYGQACSGPLPQQYGYSGVPSLESTAANLANTFEGVYYNALSHTVTPEVSQPVQVSGHPGWEVTFQVTYTNAAAQGATWADEQAAVVVADTGSGTAPAVFYTSIPASLNEADVSSLVSSLQLSAVVPAGGPTASPSPTPTPTPTTPTPGPPPPGNGHGNGNHP